jgi:trigger factor
MAFPAGNITSEEELDAFLSAEIENELGREADYLFTIRVRNFLMEKAALQMPAEFLKRWLYVINEGKFSKEDIEKDFDGFLMMFTWNYIQKHFIQTAELTVSKEEAEAEAKEFAKAQFAQYGMPSAPEEMVANFSKQILENKEQAQKIYEKLYELKVVEYVKSKVKVTTKAVSSEEFAKMAQEG